MAACALDIWELVVSALRPQDDNSFSQALVPLGAETGEIVFADPAISPHPNEPIEGGFHAVGRFRLRVGRVINP